MKSATPHDDATRYRARRPTDRLPEWILRREPRLRPEALENNALARLLELRRGGRTLRRRGEHTLSPAAMSELLREDLWLIPLTPAEIVHAYWAHRLRAGPSRARAWLPYLLFLNYSIFLILVALWGGGGRDLGCFAGGVIGALGLNALGLSAWEPWLELESSASGLSRRRGSHAREGLAFDLIAPIRRFLAFIVRLIKLVTLGILVYVGFMILFAFTMTGLSWMASHLSTEFFYVSLAAGSGMGAYLIGWLRGLIASRHRRRHYRRALVNARTVFLPEE